MRDELFDLVVLATGQRPPEGTAALAEMTGVALNPWGFCQAQGFSQCHTSQEGILAGGSFTGLRDISESVIQASSAALSASRLIHAKGGGLAQVPGREEAAGGGLPRCFPRTGQCGGGALPVRRGADRGAGSRQLTAESEILGRCPPGASIVDRICTREGWEQLTQAVRGSGANRVLIGACVPYLYGRKLRELGEALELNPALMDVVDIRSLLLPVRRLEPASSGSAMSAPGWPWPSVGCEGWNRRCRRPCPIIQRALVVGGGIAGMTAALAIADHGYEVDLVEQGGELGGNLSQHLPHPGGRFAAGASGKDHRPRRKASASPGLQERSSVGQHRPRGPVHDHHRKLRTEWGKPWNTG